LVDQRRVVEFLFGRRLLTKAKVGRIGADHCINRTTSKSTCIRFEDQMGSDAIRLLDRYADRVLCYDDDIQGTASVVLAGLTPALQIIGSRQDGGTPAHAV
jgi:hypothetical protein